MATLVHFQQKIYAGAHTQTHTHTHTRLLFPPHPYLSFMGFQTRTSILLLTIKLMAFYSAQTDSPRPTMLTIVQAPCPLDWSARCVCACVWLHLLWAFSAENNVASRNSDSTGNLFLVPFCTIDSKFLGSISLPLVGEGGKTSSV